MMTRTNQSFPCWAHYSTSPFPYNQSLSSNLPHQLKIPAHRGCRPPPPTSPSPRAWASGASSTAPMSNPKSTPPPSHRLSKSILPPPEPLAPLYKQKSWSPDSYRDEAWLRRKDSHGTRRKRRSKSVTDEDLDELKACIELGFGFDSPEMDPRLSDTLPAYGLYYAVNKHYYDTVSKPSSSSPFSSTVSECDSPSPLGSPHTIITPGDTPQTVKTRLRQWAQVVACAVRQSST